MLINGLCIVLRFSHARFPYGTPNVLFQAMNSPVSPRPAGSAHKNTMNPTPETQQIRTYVKHLHYNNNIATEMPKSGLREKV